MTKPFRIGSAVSAAVLASMIAGCATPDRLGLGGKTDGDVGLATRALAALNSNQVPVAIELAERAVEKSPEDAGFRALLGNAYFAAGRFRSAEAAYKDSLTIYSNQPQVVLKLALVQVALGKSDEAVAFLNAARSALDPSNYGLALALAGRSADAIAVLEPVARQPGADSRVRQNLALAYAFEGDWTEARTVAAQDVPADKLDARIQQWMQLAKPSKASDQVAALTGVSPAAVDQGQPVQLALRKEDTRLAQAAPAPAPADASDAAPEVHAAPRAQFAADSVTVPRPQFATVAADAPVPHPVAASAPKAKLEPAIAKAASPAPFTLAMIAAAAPEAPAAFAAFMPMKAIAAPAPKRAKVRRASAPARLRRGNPNAIMQLGSYRNPQQVAAGWNKLTQRFPALRAYLPMRAKFDSARGTYWRLSVQGFESQRDAMARCDLLKNHGGKCFVRGFAGDKPVEIASR